MVTDVIGRAKVIITGDVDSRSIDQSGKKIGSSLKTGAAVGVAALGTIAVAGVKAFQAFEEAEAQSRKLNTVLDNMGKSDAAPAVEKLAEKLSDLTAVDDDVIKQGQTLLATFSNVAESAGVTGGVFERATEAALDLSATGFGSVESASVMLGKALQDPEKGLTALGRAGVTFTEEQKTLIDGFLAANDVASAQKLILEEIEKQVGGTAEAVVTEGDRITKEMGELQENLGALVADLVSGGEDTTSFSDALHDVNTELETLGESDAWEAIAGGVEIVGDAVGFLGGLLEDATDAFQDFVQTFIDQLNLLPGLDDFFETPGERGNRDIPGFGVGEDEPYDLEIPRRRRRASGGRVSSGWILAGESGPEVIDLGSGGGYVHNNSETRRMVGASSGGTMVNNFYGPMSGADILDQWKWANRFASRFGAGTASVAG